MASPLTVIDMPMIPGFPNQAWMIIPLVQCFGHDAYADWNQAGFSPIFQPISVRCTLMFLFCLPCLGSSKNTETGGTHSKEVHSLQPRDGGSKSMGVAGPKKSDWGSWIQSPWLWSHNFCWWNTNFGWSAHCFWCISKLPLTPEFVFCWNPNIWAVFYSSSSLRIPSVSPTLLVRWQPVESGRGACDSEPNVYMDVEHLPFLDHSLKGRLGFPQKVLVLFCMFTLG